MTRAAWMGVKVGLIVTLLFATGTLCLAAGNGGATGAVIDGMTGEPLRGARLLFEGAAEGIDLTFESDLDGIFRAEVPPGTYDVAVTKDGLRDPARHRSRGHGRQDHQLLARAAPHPGSRGHSRGPDHVQGAGHGDRRGGDRDRDRVCSPSARRRPRSSTRSAPRRSSKNTGSDAAGALRRVTGISLQDSKYAYVRGLGDRYSNTMLDGARLPSTEFEKKTVPLDLFPADLIEKISVSKSYTVDKPGDFGAGFVELVTQQFPLHQIASIGAEIGYNDVTTGEPYLRYGGGLSTSGGGGQPIPGSIPNSALIREQHLQRRLHAGRARVFRRGPDRPVVAGAARRAPLRPDLQGELGHLGQPPRHPPRRQLRQRLRHPHGRGGHIYALSSTGPGGVEPLNTYQFDTTDEATRRALTGSLAYRFGNNHQVQARSLFTTLSSAEARFQDGFFSDVNNNIEDRAALLPRSGDREPAALGRPLLLRSSAGGRLLEWRGASSDATTEENRRETLYGETTPGRFVLTQNAQSGFMYWNDLEDELDDAKVDWESILDGDKPARQPQGRRARSRIRARLPAAAASATSTATPAAWTSRCRPEELFTEQNIRPNGFEIEEITRATDTYFGNHEVNAGFAQADLGWGNWRLIAGARVEDSNLEVITFDRTNPDLPTVDTVLDDTDVLPALCAGVLAQLPRPTSASPPARRSTGPSTASSRRSSTPTSSAASPSPAIPSWCRPRSAASTRAGSGSPRATRWWPRASSTRTSTTRSSRW